MNKNIFITTFSMLTLLLLLLLFPISADSSNTLKVGIHDEKVLELKDNLNKLGYMDASNTSNMFDDATLAAVKSFQKEYGIVEDGIVGEETQEVLKIALVQDEIIKNGKPMDNKTELSNRGSIRRMTTLASKYAGVKYVKGGKSPKGFDCSGLTQFVYNQMGLAIQRTARDQFNQGKTVLKGDLQPGDLVFFRKSKSNKSRIQHVGIYLGNNQFVHASSSKHKVVIADFNEYCSWSNYAGARRFVIN